MVAISQFDETSVGCIIQTALRNGAGVGIIIDRILKAQKGLFRPHEYSQKLFDLGALIYKVGGIRLGFAVAKALNLPSISAIRSRLNLPHLRPSIGFPTKTELMKNIESFFGPNVTQSSCSLMIDEIAVESRLRYDIQQDAIVGACHEHVRTESVEGLSDQKNPVDVLLDIQAKLNSREFHRAAEATMVSLARFGDSDYNPVIILASGTCKSEKAIDQLRWIELIFQSWKESPFGEALHGPIWSVTTDGNAKRRLALFQLCMKIKLSPTSDLYHLIGHLPLLNLFCGPSLITHDGDYKHLEKRLASALRSRSGILVNGAHITPKMLLKYLRPLCDLSESRLLSFFDGTDPQNVPKANSLLNNLYTASQLLSLSSRPENKPFTLLGEVLGSFVHPFTVPSMSLSEQVTSLSKCGHLLYSLYRIDGAKFLPGQLIYDMEATIKNIVWRVASELIEQSQVIETVICFKCASMQRAPSKLIKSIALTQNGTAHHINCPWTADQEYTNPNPASWTGNVTVANAAECLKSLDVQFEFNPTVLGPNVDLMRPCGVYPGIQVDINEPNPSPIPVSELMESTTEATSSINASDSSSNSIELTNNSLQLDMGQNVGDDEVGIEHVLSESAAPNELDGVESSRTRKGWIFVEGKPIHLESAVRFLLGLDGGAKSTDRLRRVCGFTRYLHPSTEPTESILGTDFRISDLVATFVQVNNQVALIVLRVTSIIARDGRLLESISDGHFSEPGITLCGQPLELRYEPDLGSWSWTGKYDVASSSATSAHRKRGVGVDFAAHFSRPINPELVEHTDGRWRGGLEVVEWNEYHVRPGLGLSTCYRGHTPGHPLLHRIWGFKHDELQDLMEDLWASCSDKQPQVHIPMCNASTTFPYRIHASGGETALCHPAASQAIQKATRPRYGKCHLCGEEAISIKRDMRLYVARHLLDHIERVHGPETLAQVRKETLRYEPSDQEYEFLHIDRETGAVTTTSRNKRRRDSDHADVVPSESGSSKRKGV
ncbi:hypothetical protein RSAG8_13186, partial [Rhizoctonia solani AG-8 WAC10335]